MVTSLHQLLSLPQQQKDALLIMAIDRLATEHRVFDSRVHICDVTTSGNYMHQVAQLKCGIQSSNSLLVDLCKQADIDIDTLSRADDFKYVLDIFDQAFPIKKEQ